MMNEQAVSTPMCAHGYWKKIAKEKMMFTTVIEVGSAVLAADANSVVTSVLSTLATWVVVGGGFWAVWGAVTLGGGLSDHNSPQIQNGVAAAALFKTLV